MHSYSDIEFGVSSGEQEGLDYPELVLNGFFDINSILSSAKGKSKFLVLGFKGAGKSLLAEKLRLDSEHIETDKVVAIKHLQDFPFKSFSKILSGDAERQAKYPTSWSWVLLLILIDILRTNSGVDCLKDEHRDVVTGLEEIGFIPTNNIARLVTASSKSSTRVALYNRFERITENKKRCSSDDLNFISVVDTLKKVVVEFPCEKDVFLVIDGLDDILTAREIQYQALSALIFEAERLNILFKREKKNIKIIILCRTDIFEKLPDPNKNKIRQSSAIELNWYNDTQSPEISNLVSMVNQRASIACGENINVFEEWFPTKINENLLSLY